MMTHRKPSAVEGSNGQQGFSLVEVLFAVVILMVGLLAMVGVFGLAVATTQSVQESQIAKQKAQELLENIFHGARYPADHVRADRQHARGHFRAGLEQFDGHRSGWAGGHGRRYSVQPRPDGVPTGINPNGVECINCRAEMECWEFPMTPTVVFSNFSGRSRFRTG